MSRASTIQGVSVYNLYYYCTNNDKWFPKTLFCSSLSAASMFTILLGYMQNSATNYVVDKSCKNMKS